MTQFHTQKELIAMIAKSIERMESGTMELTELDEHMEHVRDLYERTLILRYKAFENKEVAVVAEPEAPVAAAQPDVMMESKAPAEEPAFNLDLQQEDESLENEPFDFGLFQPEMEESEESFTPEATTNEEQSPNEEPVVETETSMADIIPDEPAPSAVLAQNGSSLTSLFKQVEEATTNQLGYEKLDTLVGSFGLNERLQYINELFDGSSESFSEAIKELDNLANLGTAKEVTTRISQQFQWDYESDTVEEFIQKLCRRYAS